MSCNIAHLLSYQNWWIALTRTSIFSWCVSIYMFRSNNERKKWRVRERAREFPLSIGNIWRANLTDAWPIWAYLLPICVIRQLDKLKPKIKVSLHEYFNLPIGRTYMQAIIEIDYALAQVTSHIYWFQNVLNWNKRAIGQFDRVFKEKQYWLLLKKLLNGKCIL